jgi:hypothetical protein
MYIQEMRRWASRKWPHSMQHIVNNPINWPDFHGLGETTLIGLVRQYGVKEVYYIGNSNWSVVNGFKGDKFEENVVCWHHHVCLMLQSLHNLYVYALRHVRISCIEIWSQWP